MNEDKKGKAKNRKNNKKRFRKKETASKGPATSEDIIKLKEHFDKKYGRTGEEMGGVYHGWGIGERNP